MNSLYEVRLPVMAFLRNIKGEVPEPHQISPHFTLNQIMARLLKFGNVHRVFVLDSNGHTYGVVSLTDVIDLFESQTHRGREE